MRNVKVLDWLLHHFNHKLWGVGLYKVYEQVLGWRVVEQFQKFVLKLLKVSRGHKILIKNLKIWIEFLPVRLDSLKSCRVRDRDRSWLKQRRRKLGIDAHHTLNGGQLKVERKTKLKRCFVIFYHSSLNFL